jgi:dipeptidyl aminopeptidase/acylaminoacyl peptidase
MVEPSPSGEYLLIARIQRPYSYLHPASAFPKEVEIWNLKGEVVASIASLPLADQVPIEGVPTGPRGFQWQPTEPAMLLWVEALDDGDPKKKVPHRDKVMMLDVATLAKGNPTPTQEVARMEHRYAGITWGEKNGLALLRDYDRDRRWSRTFLFNVNVPQEPHQLLFDRSINDRYGDPGTPLMKPLPNGQRVLWQDGDNIYLSGSGASPKGDRPFLDRFNLKTKQSERLWQCDEQAYESVVALLDEKASKFITRYEDPNTPPNYYLHLRAANSEGKKALTNFTDPTPVLRQIKKEKVVYKRPDGVQLSFTLYYPPGYEKGKRYPAVVWAYPREFNDPATAGQVIGSTQRFTTLGGSSHLFFLLAGYVVLDDATMPVVGDPETANNTFIQQIVASAKAAIDKADEMGVIDPKRVGVGGHSYGAFMTANLLAHSDLFRAGIARSGAYNRTLTPFGFQNERRTFWEAPEIYMQMSPFTHAHKIKTPLLLIHGAADNNPGTFPMQSERLYQAVRGNGGNVRLVLLPHEAHGYAAWESIEHTLYEMVAWFDKYVKNGK